MPAQAAVAAITTVAAPTPCCGLVAKLHSLQSERSCIVDPANCDRALGRILRRIGASLAVGTIDFVSRCIRVGNQDLSASSSVLALFAVCT